ncbi:MAG: hypothetical protein ACREAK_03010, partial [Nitrosarchaeum sp.]
SLGMAMKNTKRNLVVFSSIAAASLVAIFVLFSQNTAFGVPGLLNVSANPANTISFKGTQYGIVVEPGTSGTVKKVIVTFPAGTTLPSDAKVSLVTLNNQGVPGTAVFSGQTVTFTLDTATQMDPGNKLFLYIQKVRNPTNSGTTPLAQIITVTTLDSLDAIIDGPTNLGYNIQPDYLVPGAIKADNTLFKVGIGNNIIPDETLTVGGNLKLSGNIISNVTTLKIIPKAGGDICIGSGC